MAKHGLLKLAVLGAAVGAGYYAYTNYKKQNDELEAELAGEFDDSELEDEEREYSDIDVEEENKTEE